MKQPVLYLMLGYPGAGKTTVAQLIARHTGAVHIWSDLERHKMFDEPSHNEEESRRLYDSLNQRAESLLSEGKSVVFDTSFNHLADRDLLREIASKHGAKSIVVWLTTPARVARERALHSNVVRNNYEFNMTAKQFDKIATHLEPPTKNEKVIKIDGTKFKSSSVTSLFK